MKQCLICGEKTKRPIAATLWHIRLYKRGAWRFLRGNMATFGALSGVLGTIYLAFPIVNTLRHWKYRRYFLVIPNGADVCEFPDSKESAK